MNIKFRKKIDSTKLTYKVYFDEKEVGICADNKIGTGIELLDGNYKVLKDYTIQDLSQFQAISTKIDSSQFNSVLSNFDFTYVLYFTEGNPPESILILDPSLKDWNHPYSLESFASALEAFFQKRDSYKVDYDFSNGEYYINLTKNILLDSTNLDSHLSHELTILAIGALKIENQLLLNKEKTFEQVFQFPNQIKEACEQYLIYFTRFLKDLGINANTSINSEGQLSIFNVKPLDEKQALSTIRDALTIYLQLPSSPDLEKYSNHYDDIGVQHLISQIYHLKSQVLLGQAQIQMKDATIESLNLTLFQQKQILETNQEESKLEVFDGTFKVKKYQGNGFDIDVPKIFKLIKRNLFSKHDDE